MSGRVLSGLCLLLVACATHGDVEHPRPGQKGTAEYCARSAGQEGNCMACSARPGCGFCATPLSEAPVCQPGIEGDDTPPTCGVRLIRSSAQCEAPPPPAAEE